MKNAEQLHEINLQNIQQENDAKNNTSTTSTSTATRTSSNGSSGGIGAGGAPTNQRGAALQPINIHIAGVNQSNDELYGTEATAQMLAQIMRAKSNSITP